MTRRAYKRKKRKPYFAIIIVCIIVIAILFAVSGELFKRQQTFLYPQKYSEYVELYAEKYNVPTEIVYSVIHTESGFDANAVSSAGAIGLMQITPDTYSWLLYLRHEDDTKELTSPDVNIDFGTYLLSYLYNRFGSWDTVFAAYNAGMNRVSQWLEDERYTQNGTLVRIPFPETDNYVKKVNNTIIKYTQIYNN